MICTVVHFSLETDCFIRVLYLNFEFKRLDVQLDLGQSFIHQLSLYGITILIHLRSD